VFYSYQYSEGEQFYEAIYMELAKHHQTILAYEMNGEPLIVPHGSPLRLRIETQLGFKMVKWIKSVEFVSDYKNIGKGQGGQSANQRQNLYRSLGDFNIMNKVFNTSNSDTMHEKIKQDPQYLVRYHQKLDETRKLWTVDPIKVIANKINNLPIPDHIIAKMVIGDFGCGRARLAELLNNKVYNFDHHNILGENVIACDMRRTLLKRETLDVVVFSLSLMGQNWTEYIAEAKRCLRKRGMLMIAETTKSLTARLSGLKDEITKNEFEIRSEKQEGDFTFIEAMKL